MTPLRIGEAQPEDLPALLALYVHLSPEDTPVAPEIATSIFEDFAARPGAAIFLGHLGDTLVTSCTQSIIPNLTRGGRPYALIENVVTHTDHRGQGYATAILNVASEAAWAAGCYKIMLMTGSRRPSTLRFYENAGFEQSKTGFQKRRHPWSAAPPLILPQIPRG